MAFRCFVTGTDTEVGKTLVAAGLLRGLRRDGEARYWKPVQSGVVENDDTTTVARWNELPAEVLPQPVYRLKAPVSPHLAAELEGFVVDRARILRTAENVLAEPGPLVVEGAGGALTPLGPGLLVADLLRLTGLPAIIVANDRLGAINQTLLTVEACRRRDIPVLGVVLNRGQSFFGNAEAIEAYGDVKVLGRFPEDRDPRAVVEAVASELVPRARESHFQVFDV